jgi:RNA polymerase sigma-70 factor (ECF subfamily)
MDAQMNSGLSDDRSLVRRLIAGDEDALDTFFTRYGEPLYAFLYHQWEGSRADVEDLWQESLLAAYNALPSYRGQSRLFSWMCSIARHKLIDHMRRQGRRASDVFSDIPRLQVSQMSATQALPEEIVTQKATCVLVVETLTLLPEDYRRVLNSRYIEELSVSEIAQSLGKTYKATESLLSRARGAFKETLGQLERDEG